MLPDHHEVKRLEGMGSQQGGPREVSFAIQPQQQYALHLRLTPALLDALLKGQAEAATIQFGDTPAGNVSEGG